MEHSEKRYRIKSSFRFTLFTLIVIISFALFTNAVLGLADASGMNEKRYTEIEVQSGDTLWDIARSYMPDGDIRSEVRALKELNGMEGDLLFAGQRLIVPLN